MDVRACHDGLEKATFRWQKRQIPPLQWYPQPRPGREGEYMQKDIFLSEKSSMPLIKPSHKFWNAFGRRMMTM